jgi:hypothetical protein
MTASYTGGWVGLGWGVAGLFSGRAFSPEESLR